MGCNLFLHIQKAPSRLRDPITTAPGRRWGLGGLPPSGGAGGGATCRRCRSAELLLGGYGGGKPLSREPHQLAAAFDEGVEFWTFFRRLVGGMERQIKLAVRRSENHAVAAVFLKEGRFILRPVSRNISVVRTRDRFRIPVLPKARPQEKQLSVFAAVQERAVRHVGGFSREPVILPALGPADRLGGVEQHTRLACRRFQILRQRDGADRAVDNLHPFMTKYHVGRAVL